MFDHLRMAVAAGGIAFRDDFVARFIGFGIVVRRNSFDAFARRLMPDLQRASLIFWTT